jgi:hypothetical protein
MAVLTELAVWVRAVLRRPRVANALRTYEDFTGLTEVKAAQMKVLQVLLTLSIEPNHRIYPDQLPTISMFPPV